MKHLLRIVSSGLLCSSLLYSNASAMDILKKRGYDAKHAQQSGHVACLVRKGPDILTLPTTSKYMVNCLSYFINIGLHAVGNDKQTQYAQHYQAFLDGKDVDISKRPIVLSLEDFKKLVLSDVPGSLIFRGVHFSTQEKRDEYFFDILNEGVATTSNRPSGTWSPLLGKGLYFSKSLKEAYQYASFNGQDYGAIIIGFLVGDPFNNCAATGERAIKTNDKLVLCKLYINVGKGQGNENVNKTLNTCRYTINKKLGKHVVDKFGLKF